MQDQQVFSNWIKRSLPLWAKTSDALKLDALAGDAGFRRYFRVNTKPSLIAVNSPPTKEKNPEYIRLSLFLQAQGLFTPKIYAVNYQHGYMLLEDFGAKLFSKQLEIDTPNQLYNEAEQELLKIQQATSKVPSIPLHDAIKLSEELALFEQWFLNNMLDYQPSADEKILLEDFFSIFMNHFKWFLLKIYFFRFIKDFEQKKVLFISFFSKYLLYIYQICINNPFFIEINLVFFKFQMIKKK